MADAQTQVYFCHEVLSRNDLMPLLTSAFEGEMGLVSTLIDLTEYVDNGYEKWCAENGPDNFCAVFDYEVTPVVANRTAEFMLKHKHAPVGPLVTQWTVEVMYDVNLNVLLAT